MGPPSVGQFYFAFYVWVTKDVDIPGYDLQLLSEYQLGGFFHSFPLTRYYFNVINRG